MPSTRLARRLNTSDALMLGLGSMIGAGIFAAAGPAAQVAGTGLILGLFLATMVAYLNAVSMAQLAAIYPESGGAYVYGRKKLSLFWGFLAGWGFVIGKLASCSAMALTFAHYAYPAQPKPVAVGVVLALTLVNYLGVKKTAFVTKILVTAVLGTLLVVVLAALGGGGANAARLSGFTEAGVAGIAQSAGLLFFAFAGYARIATLGEEVIEPQKTIPKAILLALAITLLVYLAVFLTLILCVEIGPLAAAKAPLALAVESGSFAYLSPLIRIGACMAAMSVLLSLMAGVGRTIFAMASNRELPAFLAAVHPAHKTPHRAEICVGAIVALVVSFADLRSAIGFSSFAILSYYAIANAAAFTLRNRSWPRWMASLGFISCVGLAACLPAKSIAGGAVLFTIGCCLWFWVIGRRERV